jgi:hypothetical protein
MPITVNHQHGTITTVAGTVSANIRAGHNLLQQIYIKPATESTTYDFELLDIFDQSMLKLEDVTGTYNERLNMPAYANWTLRIFDASADEDFYYNLVINES